MTEQPLEEVITEKAFAALVGSQAEMFHRLANTLLARREAWSRQHFFQLISEADALEALLDDHGARHNRSFSYLRELVASIRGLALAGFSLSHLERRMDGYPTVLNRSDLEQAARSVRSSRTFLEQALVRLLEAALREERQHGIPIPEEQHYPESRNGGLGPRLILPRNMGQQDLENDEQKVAEMASRFLQASNLFEELGARRIEDPDERETWLQRFCTEERARVFEATVHNLQSAYDTWVKGTGLEAGDERLTKLRGHASAALHLLEAVTHLTHFVERHESGTRNEESEGRIEGLVRRADVREITLNHLLHWASTFMRRGRRLAEDLLPTYTDVRELELDLPDDLYLHARPCALIVGVVNRYATPVEMVIEGRKCNASSILELMIAVGSHPDARRFMFRGDVNPLRDLELLFRSGLGEHGAQSLPDALAYLRGGA
ncbi:MAG: HPr family phosphocarrier protein [Planctomycetes bacterium]|nr:HPr family phosphocarrier protein [Planctomycetota bacterium]